MVDKDKILGLLHQYFDTTGEITINDWGLISCKGNVTLHQMFKHERLPVSFDKVEGDFKCWQNTLKTLEGAPKSVGGDFWCFNNQLTSLEHAPKSVSGGFVCSNNSQLTTLEGMPTKLGSLRLTYTPTLPLLRSLYANHVEFYPRLENDSLQKILNRYAGQGEAGAFACGAELASAGYKENAKW